MGKQRALLALSALSLLLFAAGCAQQPSSPEPGQGPQLEGNDSALGPNSPPALAGGDSDSHGCIASAGYIWCQTLNKCIRSWEENCTSAEDILTAQARAFCGMQDIASVSVCGGYVKVVSALDGGGTTFINANGIKIICPVVSPSAMTPDCKQLLLGNNCAEQKVC